MLIAGVAVRTPGASRAGRAPSQYVRGFVIVVGCLLTEYFSVKA